jgi:2,3-bisphosphoglycerate-independent phosphoglycerate mutase
MKYILILGDGMADEPLEELGGKTPLESAKTPNMDRIAGEGRCGMLKTVPEGYEPGSDIANLSVLGYRPEECYTGRGPLEAISMGVNLGEDDIAYRCNLVTIRDGIMEDFSAGHISGEEGKELIESLNEKIREAKGYPGVSYRNLLVVPGGEGCSTTPPHDIVDREVAPYLPKGGDSEVLIRCMDESREVFKEHPVNAERLKAGKRPATSIWPWSGGKKPAMENFEDKFGFRGAMISAVDLLKGIALCAGMDTIEVPGATGYLDTDYMAKAEYAVSALRDYDFIYLHIEAPDEAGHLGSTEEKIKAIESVDEVTGYILDNTEDTVIAVLPDHPTPIRIKTHTSEPVPFAVLGRGHDDTECYSEREIAEKGGFGLRRSEDLMKIILGEI